MSLATRLKQLIAESDMSSGEIARRSGITAPYLSNLAHDKVVRPSAEVAYKLSQVLGVSMLELMDKERDVWCMVPMSERMVWSKAHLFKSGSDVAVCGQNRMTGPVGGPGKVVHVKTDKPENVCFKCVYPHEERIAEAKRRAVLVEVKQ